MSNRFPILFYHNIIDNDNHATSIKNFNNQMDFLYNRGFKSFSIDELYKIQKEKKSIKAFSITFDDGYRDNLLNALPIMKKYNFSGTSFIVNDYIGKSNVWDLENKKIKQHSLMNSDEILQWINEGMHIGSHGLSHSNLIKEIDSVAISEIANSKLLLEKNFNIEIDTFCYPFGAYNDAIIELVKGAGYKFAVTTKRGRLKNLNEHAYEIPRVPIGNNIGYFKFLLKTITNYEDL